MEKFSFVYHSLCIDITDEKRQSRVGNFLPEGQKPVIFSNNQGMRWFPTDLPGTSCRCTTCANIPTLSTSSKITTETGLAIQSI